jgi:hypothetical protein
MLSKYLLHPFFFDFEYVFWCSKLAWQYEYNLSYSLIVFHKSKNYWVVLNYQETINFLSPWNFHWMSIGDICLNKSFEITNNVMNAWYNKKQIFKFLITIYIRIEIEDVCSKTFFRFCSKIQCLNLIFLIDELLLMTFYFWSLSLSHVVHPSYSYISRGQHVIKTERYKWLAVNAWVKDSSLFSPSLV